MLVGGPRRKATQKDYSWAKPIAMQKMGTITMNSLTYTVNKIVSIAADMTTFINDVNLKTSLSKRPGNGCTCKASTHD